MKTQNVTKDFANKKLSDNAMQRLSEIIFLNLPDYDKYFYLLQIQQLPDNIKFHELDEATRKKEIEANLIVDGIKKGSNSHKSIASYINSIIKRRYGIIKQKDESPCLAGIARIIQERDGSSRGLIALYEELLKYVKKKSWGEKSNWHVFHKVLVNSLESYTAK